MGDYVSSLVVAFRHTYISREFACGSKTAADEYVWNVGQIVAITIWVPVVSKFVYMLLCKFKLPEGSLYEEDYIHACIRCKN